MVSVKTRELLASPELPSLVILLLLSSMNMGPVTLLYHIYHTFHDAFYISKFGYGYPQARYCYYGTIKETITKNHMEENIMKPKINSDSFDAVLGSGNKKKILIIIAVVLGLALFAGGYFFYRSVKNVQDLTDSQQAAKEATKGVLPPVSNNPLESRPNLNPVDNTNPITEIKNNPFE